MPPSASGAVRLRQHLKLAAVNRAELFATDETSKRLRFHDLRSTGLTWLAIRGEDTLKIQQRAGHSSFETTQKYIRTAEAVGEAIGGVFPELPKSLIDQFNRSDQGQVYEMIVEET